MPLNFKFVKWSQLFIKIYQNHVAMATVVKKTYKAIALLLYDFNDMLSYKVENKQKLSV